LFEAAESLSRRQFVGIVAGRAAENSFLQVMPLVEIELGEDVFMARGTGFCRGRLEQVRVRPFGVYGMTGLAILRSFAMGSGYEPGAVVGVAFQASFGLALGRVIGRKGKNVFTAPFLDVLFRSEVTRSAVRRSDGRMRPPDEAFYDVLVALTAGLAVLRSLRTGLGRGQDSGDEKSQTEEGDRLERQGDQPGVSFRWHVKPPYDSHR